MEITSTHDHLVVEVFGDCSNCPLHSLLVIYVKTFSHQSDLNWDQARDTKGVEKWLQQIARWTFGTPTSDAINGQPVFRQYEWPEQFVQRKISDIPECPATGCCNFWPAYGSLHLLSHNLKRSFKTCLAVQRLATLRRAYRS